MSVVLYALGLALMLWGGYVLLSGDMIATLDIAASLVGSGAFAIGLGAVAAAIKRLARTIAEQDIPRGAASSERDAYDVPRRDDDLPPLQELRRTAPHPVVTSAPKPAAAGKPTASVDAAVAAALERDLDTPPAPPRRPRIEIAPPRPPAPDPVVPSAAALSKHERRLRAREDARAETEAETPLPIPAPAVTVPPVVAPILGGGFAGPADAEPGPAPELDVASDPESPVEPETVAESAEAVSQPAPEPVLEPVAPVVPPQAEKRLPEPKVPEWLARARARREARAAVEEPKKVVPAATAPAPTPAPAAAEPEPAPAYEPSDALSADEAPERAVLREGEHNGVLYRFYADGSVEAESEHGMRRFDSLEELRATVLAVRGHIEGEDDDDPAARPEAEMMVAPPVDAPSDPAAEEGAVAVEPPLNPAGPDDDFEAALAALESGLSDDRKPNPAAPSLDEVRPGRDC